MFKAISGTRGKAHMENATRLVEAAIGGDRDSQDLIVRLGAYSPAGRLWRVVQEGSSVLKSNLQQGAGNKTGLKVTEADELTVDFLKWGQNNMVKFYDWIKLKFSHVLKSKSFQELLRGLWSTLKPSEEECREMLLRDLDEHGRTKTKWKNTLIKYVAEKLRSA